MRRYLLFIPILFLSACAGSLSTYNEPEIGAADVFIVKGLHPNVKIMKVDGKSTDLSFFKGVPNSVRLLPGEHTIFVAYELSTLKLLASGNSSIEVKGKTGETYFVRHQFYGKQGDKLYFWLLDSDRNPIYKKDDLADNIDKIVNKYGQSFYQLPDKYIADFFLSLVRQKAFEHPWSVSTSEILLSFGLINKKDQFNCNDFFLKLEENQREKLREQMNKYPFVCKDSNYSEQDAFNAFEKVLPQNINTNEAADAHWAWYSATGNSAILKRILDNYLNNQEACINCIEWSYPSIAQENSDVKNYLLGYMEDKSPKDRSKLEKLVPRK